MLAVQMSEFSATRILFKKKKKLKQAQFRRNDLYQYNIQRFVKIISIYVLRHFVFLEKNEHTNTVLPGKIQYPGDLADFEAQHLHLGRKSLK